MYSFIKFYENLFYKQGKGGEPSQRGVHEQRSEVSIKVGALTLNENNVRESRKGVYNFIYKIINIDS